MERVVVVGAGLAGAHTVRALRAAGWTGPLTLVGAERHPPYDRPPLSKAVLLGRVDDTTLDVDLAGIDLRLGCRGTALAPGELHTDAGAVAFDALVLAVGAEPVALPGRHPRTHLLRTIDDARALRADLVTGRSVVIVGAGWIGAEVATAAHERGCRVTVVEAAPAPLAQALGPDVGGHTTAWYAESGVALLTGARVDALEPDAVHLADGRRLPADVVVVGIGVRPPTGWLAGSGVVADGSGAVVVDEQLRTSLPGVFAVGDCATFPSRRFGARLHVQHWDVALRAPAVVAANLLGSAAVHDPVPYFWSEQFGRMVQYVGHHPVADRLVERGDPRQRAWAACWLRGDRVVAAVTVDRPRDLAAARRLIERGTPVDPDRVADPGMRLAPAAP